MLLKLELTESALLDHVEDTIAIMNALKDVGVRFSLDDFGTGYSSLQYLRLLPLYQLKIDRSFVQDIAGKGSDQAIVRTIIAMAHTLNLNVIAEGVETQVQQGILLDSGCVHYQAICSVNLCLLMYLSDCFKAHNLAVLDWLRLICFT